MVKRWNDVKDRLYQLYCIERLTLDEVRTKLREEVGFEASWVHCSTIFQGVLTLIYSSLRAYKNQIKKWQWRTYRGSSEAVRAVTRKKQKRTALQQISRLSEPASDLVQETQNAPCGLPSPVQLTLDAQLFAAVRNCNADSVEELLCKGASLTAADYNGSTPLHITSTILVPSNSWMKRETVRKLLRRGADTNVLNIDRKSPFHLLISIHQESLGFFLFSIEDFLSHGADVATPTADGRMPLQVLLNTLLCWLKALQLFTLDGQDFWHRWQLVFERFLDGANPRSVTVMLVPILESLMQKNAWSNKSNDAKLATALFNAGRGSIWRGAEGFRRITKSTDLESREVQDELLTTLSMFFAKTSNPARQSSLGPGTSPGAGFGAGYRRLQQADRSQRSSSGSGSSRSPWLSTQLLPGECLV